MLQIYLSKSWNYPNIKNQKFFLQKWTNSFVPGLHEEVSKTEKLKKKVADGLQLKNEIITECKHFLKNIRKVSGRQDMIGSRIFDVSSFIILREIPKVY